MPVTAPTPPCVRCSRGSVLLTSRASSRTPPCGRAPTRRRRSGPGPGVGARRAAWSATPTTSPRPCDQYLRRVPRDEEWLLLKWPTEEEKPTNFWLATVPENVAFDRF